MDANHTRPDVPPARRPSGPPPCLAEPVDAADALDLLVPPETREAGCFAILPCSRDGVPSRSMVLVDAVPSDADPALLAGFLDQALPMLAGDGSAGLVFARGRDGGVLITDDDRRWHQVVLDACHRHEVTLLSAHLLTPAAVRTFPGDLRLVG